MRTAKRAEKTGTMHANRIWLSHDAEKKKQRMRRRRLRQVTNGPALKEAQRTKQRSRQIRSKLAPGSPFFVQCCPKCWCTSHYSVAIPARFRSKPDGWLDQHILFDDNTTTALLLDDFTRNTFGWQCNGRQGTSVAQISRRGQTDTLPGCHAGSFTDQQMPSQAKPHNKWGLSRWHQGRQIEPGIILRGPSGWG